MSHDSSNGVPEGKSNDEIALSSSPSIVVDDNGLDPSSSTADGASSANTSGPLSWLMSQITPARDRKRSLTPEEMKAIQDSIANTLESKFSNDLGDIQAAITILSDHIAAQRH